MTDKVQKIKEWISKEQDGLMDAQGNFEYPEHEGAYHILCNLDAYIDSLQEESVSENLGEYINELSKQFPEVSFAKLSRIAVRVAKWQKENLWKPADGDDLPEINSEVIVLVKYSTQKNIHDKEYSTYRVEFGHRPNPNGWNGKSIATGSLI